MEVSSGKQIRRMKGLTEVETAAIFDYAQEQFNIEASLVLHFYQFVSSQDSLLYLATPSLTIEVNLIKHESHMSSQHVISPHCPKHSHYTIHIIYIPPANLQRLIHLKNVVYACSLARSCKRRRQSAASCEVLLATQRCKRGPGGGGAFDHAHNLGEDELDGKALCESAREFGPVVQLEGVEVDELGLSVVLRSCSSLA